MPKTPTGNRAFRIVVLVFLGIVVGGGIGLLAAPSNTLKENPDPQAQTFGALLNPLVIFLRAGFAIIGAGLGGGLGAVAGFVIDSRESPPADSTAPAEVTNDDQSAEVEITRLQSEIKRLQGRVDELRREDQH